jgi:pimeloyl-ACP methyl ester carboxylesterase
VPLRERFRTLLSEANSAYVDELDGPELAPRLRTELLVVHDRDDREVPYEDGEETASRWPGARLVTTTGLGHRRILGDRDVVETVAAFATGARAPRLLLDEWDRIGLDLADREGRRSRAFP